MFTLDNVDWTQIPPDNNTGIQFPIQLHTSGPLALSNAHVAAEDAPDLSTAALTLKADVTNARQHARPARCPPRSPPPAGRLDPSRPQPVTRRPGRDRDRRFTPATIRPALIDHPQRVVALPDGRPAAVRAGHRRCRRRRRQPDTRVGDLRHPHDHHAPDRAVDTDRPGRRPASSSVNGVPFVVPRRRLVGGPVPALLRGRHGQPDRDDQEPRPERDPDRGQADARQTSTSRWTGPGS